MRVAASYGSATFVQLSVANDGLNADFCFRGIDPITGDETVTYVSFDNGQCAAMEKLFRHCYELTET